MVHMSRGTLCKLALVHRALGVPCQKALFEFVELDFDGTKLLSDMLLCTVPYKVGVGNFISHISLSIKEQTGDTAWGLNRLGGVLPQMANLKSLTLFITVDQPRDVLIEVYHTLMGGFPNRLSV